MRRLPRLLLAAALALPCLGAYGQEGDPAFRCFSVEQGRAALDTAKARGFKVEILTGDTAQRFVAALNAMEPVTNYKAEKVIVLTSEDVGGVALVTGDTACAFRAPVPAGVLKSWVATARGVQA